MRLSPKNSARLRGVLLAMLLCTSAVAEAKRIQVGPEREYKRPSEAAQVAKDGDVVEIDAGNYAGDVAVWRQHRLTLRGVARYAHIQAAGQAAEGKAIWVIKGDNTLVENMEFSGAAVSDRNGAAIRQEGAGLTVRNCFFHDNENGILGGAGNVLIERTEFARNGSGDGYTHNIYILDRTQRFTLRYSYTHHAKVGHNVKSRARENHILYNRVTDESDGTASYSIDLPNGGIAYVIGNVIHKGRMAENETLVRFGAEGLQQGDNEFYVVNNTMVNDRHAGRFVVIADGTAKARIANNLFIGSGVPVTGPGEQQRNLTDAKLVDRAGFDYRLAARSAAVDGGADPGSANGMRLAPSAEYRHPLDGTPRPTAGAVDVGAYEFVTAPR